MEIRIDRRNFERIRELMAKVEERKLDGVRLQSPKDFERVTKQSQED